MDIDTKSILTLKNILYVWMFVAESVNSKTCIPSREIYKIEPDDDCTR